MSNFCAFRAAPQTIMDQNDTSFKLSPVRIVLDLFVMREFPECSDIFARIFICLSPKSQMNHYYATGDTESCLIFIHDWMKCVEAQSCTNSNKKATILESTHIMKAHRALKANSLWSLKEKPSW